MHTHNMRAQTSMCTPPHKHIEFPPWCVYAVFVKFLSCRLYQFSFPVFPLVLLCHYISLFIQGSSMCVHSWFLCVCACVLYVGRTLLHVMLSYECFNPFSVWWLNILKLLSHGLLQPVKWHKSFSLSGWNSALENQSKKMLLFCIDVVLMCYTVYSVGGILCKRHAFFMLNYLLVFSF